MRKITGGLGLEDEMLDGSAHKIAPMVGCSLVVNGPHIQFYWAGNVGQMVNWVKLGTVKPWPPSDEFYACYDLTVSSTNSDEVRLYGGMPAP